MKLPLINSASEAMELVREIGFLPLFRCSIDGFSIQDLTPKERWFVDGVEGPWEWREALAASDEFAYGKLFERKAGFIHRSILPKFINYRRDGYDFDARYEDSLAPMRAKRIVDVLTLNGPRHVIEIKREAGFMDGVTKGFDGVLTQLQMQTYVTILSFDYKINKLGQSYGFGMGRYGLMEDKFGADLVAASYGEPPDASYRFVLQRLLNILPHIEEDIARKMLA